MFQLKTPETAEEWMQVVDNQTKLLKENIHHLRAKLGELTKTDHSVIDKDEKERKIALLKSVGHELYSPLLTKNQTVKVLTKHMVDSLPEEVLEIVTSKLCLVNKAKELCAGAELEPEEEIIYAKECEQVEEFTLTMNMDYIVLTNLGTLIFVTSLGINRINFYHAFTNKLDISSLCNMIGTVKHYEKRFDPKSNVYIKFFENFFKVVKAL